MGANNKRKRISSQIINVELKTSSLARKFGMQYYLKEEVDEALSLFASQVRELEDEYSQIGRELENLSKDRTAHVLRSQETLPVTERNQVEVVEQLKGEQDKNQRWSDNLREIMMSAENQAEGIRDKARLEAQSIVDEAREQAQMLLSDAQEKSDAMVQEAAIKLEQTEQHYKAITSKAVSVQNDIRQYGETMISFGENIKNMTSSNLSS